MTYTNWRHTHVHTGLLQRLLLIKLEVCGMSCSLSDGWYVM